MVVRWDTSVERENVIPTCFVIRSFPFPLGRMGMGVLISVMSCAQDVLPSYYCPILGKVLNLLCLNVLDV
jgi:hypothetical protein